MRLRFLPLFGVIAALCLSAGAQSVPSGFIRVSSSRLVDQSGVPVGSATVCAQAMTPAGPLSVNVGGGGTTTTPPVCAQASNGAWTLNLPDGALSVPLNATFAITATDNASGDALLAGYSHVQPHSQTCMLSGGNVTCVANGSADWCQSSGCNFDQLTPNAPANALIVQGQKGNTGAVGTPGPSGNTLAGTTSPEAYETAAGFTVTNPGTTDEAPYIQDCLNQRLYQCIMEQRAYGISSTLVLPDLAYWRGAGMTNGTRIYSHVNGPAITMAPGPNQGLNVGGFELILDPTLPNGQGIVLEAQHSSTYPGGGVWNSTFDHIEIDYCALECVLTYTSDQDATINQFVTWNDITIQGPSQAHPNALWKSVGPNNQFDRYKVSVNGDDNNAHYPNALEYMGPDGSGAAPSDVGCIKCTYQGGATGVGLSQVRTYSQYAGYIENVGTPISASASYGVQFDFMDVRNSGYVGGVMVAGGGVSGSFLHNTMDASATATQPAHGVSCANNNQIDDSFNTTNIGNVLSSGCGEQQAVTGSTLIAYSPVVLVFADNGATPIQSISAPQVGSGKTVTLKVFTTTGGASSTMLLGGGGDIDFNGYPSPLVLPTGTSVTLRWRDLLQQWAIESTTATLPLGVKTYVSTGANAFFMQSLISTNSGNSTGIEAGALCTIQYRWTGSGGDYWETAVCSESGGAIGLYSSPAANLGGESFSRLGGYTPGLPGVTKTCSTYPTVQDGIVTGC